MKALLFITSKFKGTVHSATIEMNGLLQRTKISLVYMRSFSSGLCGQWLV